MPAPGDIRNCMTALSDDEELLAQLFRYRFTGGGLDGHSFGNLFLTALADVCGDFAQAVQLSSAILKTRGEIYPSSACSSLQLEALLRNGKRVRGETKITASHSGIARLSLVPPTPVRCPRRSMPSSRPTSSASAPARCSPAASPTCWCTEFPKPSAAPLPCASTSAT